MAFPGFVIGYFATTNGSLESGLAVYREAENSGELRDETGITDRNGEVISEYVAGETPGTVSIEITVRSTLPLAHCRA